MPMQRSSPGDERPLGKPPELGLLPVVFLAGTQPLPQGYCWQGTDPQSRVPAPPSAPQGPCPTRAVRTSHPPQQLSQPLPAPKGISLGGRKEENHPRSEKEPRRRLLPPLTLEYIKLCSLVPTPPFRSPRQPESVPSPSLNPSPSSAKGGLRPFSPPLPQG